MVLRPSRTSARLTSSPATVCPCRPSLSGGSRTCSGGLRSRSSEQAHLSVQLCEGTDIVLRRPMPRSASAVVFSAHRRWLIPVCESPHPVSAVLKPNPPICSCTTRGLSHEHARFAPETGFGIAPADGGHPFSFSQSHRANLVRSLLCHCAARLGCPSLYLSLVFRETRRKGHAYRNNAWWGKRKRKGLADVVIRTDARHT